MKTSIVGSILVAMVGLFTGSAMAQQNRARDVTVEPAKLIVRASEVIGMDVKNHADEDLGSIEDLAINPNTGEIVYAAVSLGGFLGVGDKLFAVPWSALECRTEESAATQLGAEPSRVAILNVDKESLQNAQGFDKDNWPNMADERWQQENDRHFQLKSRSTGTSSKAESNQTKQETPLPPPLVRTFLR
jgi:sporulation protein YlmC with PRC-barrel domain